MRPVIFEEVSDLIRVPTNLLDRFSSSLVVKVLGMDSIILCSFS